VSIWLTFAPFPGAFLQPPILQEDLALQRFLDDIAAERFQQAYENPTLAFSSSEYTLEEFTQWAKLANERYGRGRIICSTFRSRVPDPIYGYGVYFEKAGFRTLGFSGPDYSYSPKSQYWLITSGLGDLSLPRYWMGMKKHEQMMKELTDD
jgi:hypothetical protein